MNKKILLICTILIAITFLSGCKNKEAILSDKAFALDTLIDIKVYHYDNDGINEEVIDEAFDLIYELENTLSAHIIDTDIYNISKAAGKSAVKVQDITYELLLDSFEYSKLTDGLFDITSGPLIDLWAIDPPYGYVPNKSELASTVSKIDYKMIDFQDDNQVMLKNSGMIINLGAIAKGAIADEVKAYLVDNGVNSALINLGGNVLLIGNKIDGSDFAIGVQNPNDDRGAYLLSINVSDNAVVSSGDYERFFEHEGKIYHHILNPKTGYPCETNIKQVTIVAPNSTQADALSTSILLVGLEKGIEIIESLDNVEAIFITKDKKIYITDGLDGKFDINEAQMSNFTLVEKPQDLY